MASELTDLDLDLLRERSLAATQGEWKLVEGPPGCITEGHQSTMAPGGSLYVVENLDRYRKGYRRTIQVASWTYNMENARFIAAANPAAVHALATEVQRLRWLVSGLGKGGK